jgi:NAD(P)H-flavin reductase
MFDTEFFKTVEEQRAEETKGSDSMYAGMLREIGESDAVLTSGQISMLDMIAEKLRKKQARLDDIEERMREARGRGEHLMSLNRLKVRNSQDVLVRSEAKKIEALYAYACRG